MYIYAVICHRLTSALKFTIDELLKSERSIVIVHIDKKTPNHEFNNIVSNLKPSKNLHILNAERIDVKWGDVSQIDVMLLLLKNAQRFNFKYFSLISGDDIPLSSNFHREAFFEKSYNSKTEFIGFNPKNDAIQRLSLEYPKFMFEKNHSILGKVRRRLYISFAKLFRKRNISALPKLYKGAQWFTLTDRSIDYIFNFLKENPSFYQAFKHSLCGDEVFFQTIIFNSPFAKLAYQVNQELPDWEKAMRFIDWTSGPDYPKTLDESDFARMKESGFLFARKVNSNISEKILFEHFSSGRLKSN